MLSLGKARRCNERSKSRSQRKNLFSCNQDVSSEITPVEVSQKLNMGSGTHTHTHYDSVNQLLNEGCVVYGMYSFGLLECVEI